MIPWLVWLLIGMLVLVDMLREMHEVDVATAEATRRDPWSLAVITCGCLVLGPVVLVLVMCVCLVAVPIVLLMLTWRTAKELWATRKTDDAVALEPNLSEDNPPR